jgi:outer membrane protein assembly factor BamB
MKRVILSLAAFGLLGGCGIFGGDKKPTTPTIGERIPVLSARTAVEVDPALADVQIVLPEPQANTDWAQRGGNAAKNLGHVALGNALNRAWAVGIGRGSEPRQRLGSGPVVGGGRVYTVDTLAVVRAFDATTGAQVWAREVGDPKDRRGSVSFLSGESTGAYGLLFGGGVSFDEGRVYATSGLGDVEAIDAATGAQIWRSRPGGPLRGAPTIASGNVYVVSQDNQLFALDPADGKLRWQGAGMFEVSGVLGAASPAAAAGTVVAGFSSGELTGYRYENGRAVWQEALARTSISTAVATVSDIDASPVIDNGRVYALGQGGRMVALELNTGQRLWELNIAGISTPWVAGEWVFVVTDQAQLLAVARATGRVKWMTQLRRYRDQDDKKGFVQWVGPVLAGGRLILANSRGELANVDPATGAVLSTVDTGMPVSLPMAVANNTLYVLHDEGRLTAWR